MRTHLIFALFFLSALISHVARAGSRVISLDWEVAEDAQTYEMEIGRKGATRAHVRFEGLALPNWSGEMKSGRYWMRVRGRDDRNLPGEWSDMLEFQVKIDAPETLQPASDEIVKATGLMNTVILKWKAVEAAKSYSVTILNDEQKPVLTRTSFDPLLAVELGSGMKYTWQVLALDADGSPGEKPSDPVAFTIEGSPLLAPRIEIPETRFVRILRIKRPDGAEKVDVSLLRFNEPTKVWQNIFETNLDKSGEIIFRPEWPGGKYQVLAAATARYRTSSPTATLNIEIADGLRTIDAERRALIRGSIERMRDWYLESGFNYSKLNYDGTIYEENRSAKIGTSGVGLYVSGGKIWRRSPWALVGSLGADSYKINSEAHNFLNAKIAAMARWAPHRTTDLRIRLGIFRQEAPQILSVLSDTSLGILTTQGPLIGADWLYALTPTVSVQAFGNITYAYSGKSAGGASVKPAFSEEAGVLLGSRLGSKLSGSVGYIFKTSKFTFDATNASLESSAGQNDISIVSHTLRTTLELDF